MSYYTKHAVRGLRVRVGMSQTEFAAALGVTRQSVANWENGVNTPKMKLAEMAKKVEKQLRAGSSAEPSPVREEQVKARETHREENTTRPVVGMILAQGKLTPPDIVNHPPHYTQGSIETIDAIEGLGLDSSYHLGNAVKYISRAGKKEGSTASSDIDKAIWYLNRYKESCLSSKV